MKKILIIMVFISCIVFSSCQSNKNLRELEKFGIRIKEQQEEIIDCLNISDGWYEYISTNTNYIEDKIQEEYIYFIGSYENENIKEFYYSNDKNTYMPSKLEKVNYSNETIIYDETSFLQKKVFGNVEEVRNIDFSNKKIQIDFGIEYKKPIKYGNIFNTDYTNQLKIEYADVLDDYSLRILYIDEENTKCIIDYYFNEKYEIIRIEANVIEYSVNNKINSAKNIVIKKTSEVDINQINSEKTEEFKIESTNLYVSEDYITLYLQGSNNK